MYQYNLKGFGDTIFQIFTSSLESLRVGRSKQCFLTYPIAIVKKIIVIMRISLGKLVHFTPLNSHNSTHINVQC